MGSYENILFEAADGIATLTLTRLSLDITMPDSGPEGHEPQ